MPMKENMGHKTMRKANNNLQHPELQVFGEYLNPMPRNIKLGYSYYPIVEVKISASQSPHPEMG